MNRAASRAAQLAARRISLLARGADQREQLIRERDHIATKLQGVDRGIEIVRQIVSHPFLVMGAIATVIAIGPFKVLRWIGQGAFWLRVARGAGGYLKSGYFKFLGDDASTRPSDDG